MLGREYEIFKAGLLCGGHPLTAVESRRGELLRSFRAIAPFVLNSDSCHTACCGVGRTIMDRSFATRANGFRYVGNRDVAGGGTLSLLRRRNEQPAIGVLAAQQGGSSLPLPRRAVPPDWVARRLVVPSPDIFWEAHPVHHPLRCRGCIRPTPEAISPRQLPASAALISARIVLQDR